MTEDELRRLLLVACLRPVAEYGRETILKPAGERKGRATWTKAELTHATIEAAAERGRHAVRNSLDYLDQLADAGRERALIYKTLVLTGHPADDSSSSARAICCSCSTPCRDRLERDSRMSISLMIPPRMQRR
ncbi:MAG: hypothetical protein KDA75_20080 [Planctomycetaceae bacterium]|nr:hypothetical protein [Planctomycetaceae bacterium]